MPASAQGSAQRAVEAVAGAGRVRLNFNADWRFRLGDVRGAQQPSFEDAGWDRIGLPHSFSIPYFQSPDFYAGPGWYRKIFDLPRLPHGRRLSLEFEGAFQKAEVFVNGVAVGSHRGGYTGFPVDITAAVKPGRNVVAVRVDNQWDPTLAPRAGEHVFSGGLYRDVWLVANDAVHVPWTGTRITTPQLTAASGLVAAETEVRNDAPEPAHVRVRTRIVDCVGHAVATLPDRVVIAPANATVIAEQLSGPIKRPKLWSPETPNLYHAETRLMVSGRIRDVFQTEFGFRWFSWTADRGFFLNGEHRYFRGANVHQDQAGWGDAVTNGAIDRDVQLMKDAGFDFIRGSHYPHDPHFAEATDHIGLLFLSEAPFWGTGGFKSDWGGSAYPTDPKDRAAFDQSVKQQLAEMIRINRNHPSIVLWGMDNEVFFSAPETMPDVRRLLAEEVALAHKLDPTRPAAVDGAQRGEIDHIGDVAGYNGDGAVLFPNPGVANFVAEYDSTMTNRPGEYEPGWGDLVHTPGADPARPYSWRFPWRSGEVIWSGFDHGSIAGRRFASMGIVDYSRLPKRAWYWYRNAYRGVAPPGWPQPGKAAALNLAASAPVLTHADGTDDVQLVVTVVDAQGQPLSNSPPVHLAIEAGPGELPTGRAIDFTPDGDIPIRDGKAAIAMRSWQAGVSRIRATSPGLEDAVLSLRTTDGPPFVPGATPLAGDRPYTPTDHVSAERPEETFGLHNPTAASSSAPGHPSSLANDNDDKTAWLAAAGDPSPSLTVDPERIVQYRRIRLIFPQAAGYGVKAEVKGLDGRWRTLAEQPLGGEARRELEITTARLIGGPVRLTIRAPENAPAGMAEVRLVGVLQDH
ncbi:beta-galactosidase [Phenylobacterium montanum]|uniref:Beta-galactosidase n=2 Tax=Phenylobacterium montanum TaxID=2823693 RepID=A0A975G422_9CAUL|nr:beta-galactosidase [Caulobacter sp. S6]